MSNEKLSLGYLIICSTVNILVINNAWVCFKCHRNFYYLCWFNIYPEITNSHVGEFKWLSTYDASGKARKFQIQ